jgi:L-ascorbate metabolism protein UlaG (beta-lactamase superfamily)
VPMRHLLLGTLPVCLALGCGTSPDRTPDAAEANRLTWIGHAGFEIVSHGGTRVLIDPWVSDNPAVPPAYADTIRYSAPSTRPAVIVVTHPHGDHDADVARLARMSGARVVATGDHLQQMKIPDDQQLSINIGGVQQVGDVTIHAVPAMHSVEPGRALGYVLRFRDGRSLYHTGDTWAFSDMALIEEYFHPTVLLVASGGGRAGQDPATAAKVARTYFRAQIVIPMHYGSLPPPFATREQVTAAFGDDPPVRLITPGMEISF